MAILFAFGAALSWGISDFVGGLASRRASALTVTFLSVALPLPLLVVAAFLLGGHAPHLGDVLWGCAAGVGGIVGFGYLMRALALGAMTVVAPIAAVVAALLPVIVGLALGERPSTNAELGMVAGLVALVLLATGEHTQLTGGSRRLPPTILLIALVSGAGSGLFLVCLAEADHATGLWPLVFARTLGSITYVLICLHRRAPLVTRGKTRHLVVASAVLGTLASGLYLLSAQRGLLSIAAVLGSMSPGVTVLMAAIVLRERIGGAHGAGLAVAGVAIGLIVLG